jgi:hypothetical protein
VRGLVAGRTLRPEDKEERRRGHEEEGDQSHGHLNAQPVVLPIHSKQTSFCFLQHHIEPLFLLKQGK